MRFRYKFPLLASMLLSANLLVGSPAYAGYYSLIHNNTDTSEGTGDAIVIAMPSTDNGRVRVNRIRISSSKSTSLDFRFRSARESDSLGDTKTVSGWSCSLPGCDDVFSIEGIKLGELYDLDSLQLSLSQGHRLYVYTNASIGADYFTLEVWWTG